MLRNLADDIEEGRYGDVETIAIALQGKTIELFGGGRNSDFRFCSYLFSVGVARLAATAG